MEKALRILCICMTLLLGLLAMGGGIMLIIDPSGKSMQFSLTLIENTPFTNYLIPGIILTVLVGLFSLVVGILIIKKYKHYPLLMILLAGILIGWLTIELIINIEFWWPEMHISLYAMSLLLILTGGWLKVKVKAAR